MAGETDWLKEDALSSQMGKVIQLAGLGGGLALGQLLILEQSNAELFEQLFFFW